MSDFEIIDHTKDVIEAKNTAILRALEAVGLHAEGEAKMLAPVDTGRLRNSITHGVEGTDTAYIGSNVEYAPYQEMGTRNAPAQPYLKPAIMNHLPEYRAIIEDQLRNG